MEYLFNVGKEHGWSTNWNTSAKNDAHKSNLYRALFAHVVFVMLPYNVSRSFLPDNVSRSFLPDNVVVF